MILLASALLSCSLSYSEIENEDILCYYTCQDTSTEFARTLKQFSCPKRLRVDRPAIPWRDRLKYDNK